MEDRDTQRAGADQLLKSIQYQTPAFPGHLKIFFGYAAGVGKTYAMLQAAHEAKKRGIDVVCGYIEPHSRRETQALKKGLEQLGTKTVNYNGIVLHDFDLDQALARNPQIVLVDELAHTNAPGLRHTKRYMDVLELLRNGIDVYTTVNVQHLESLCDTVAAITGIQVQERIPDSVFDQASQVELVDLEPQELLERFREGKVYAPEQAELAARSFFTEKNLSALREIALRRCADRVNELVESIRVQSGEQFMTEERILVCLSSSPSNAKIIRTAARMAKAFHGSLCALYVQTPQLQNLDEANKKRLEQNIKLAQSLGANVETVNGENISEQIAQYARISNASKIVLGRSHASHFPFARETLTEKLIKEAPGLDIYIIPDNPKPQSPKTRNPGFWQRISWKDFGILVLYLAIATGIGFWFKAMNFDEANIVTVYLLSVLLCSISTASSLCAVISAILSTLCFNYFFVEPFMGLNLTTVNYVVTVVTMLASGLLSGSLAHRLRENSEQSAASAWHSQVLFECNQALQKAADKKEILDVTARQIQKLLDKSIVLFVKEGEQLRPGVVYTKDGKGNLEISDEEYGIASWVYRNNKRAGFSTDTLSSSRFLYLAIRIEERVYGVCGIDLEGQVLMPEETSMLLAILGESAMALEMRHNAKARQEAAVAVENERLRTNLLRSISHDFRTPLTAISGNAAMLQAREDQISPERKEQLLGDIQKDADWLHKTMDKVLAITRLEQDDVTLQKQPELMDDIIEDAISHFPWGSQIHMEESEDPIIVSADASLLSQVIYNLLENAHKYGKAPITVRSMKRDGQAWICVEDEGDGIPDERKSQVFEQFYTTSSGHQQDGKRSVGLGLALCKSIVEKHNGKIWIEDSRPKGCRVVFAIPLEEKQ